MPVAPGRAPRPDRPRGAITVNDTPAGTRDGVTVVGETSLAITVTDEAEIVMVEVDQAH